MREDEGTLFFYKLEYFPPVASQEKKCSIHSDSKGNCRDGRQSLQRSGLKWFYTLCFNSWLYYQFNMFCAFPGNKKVEMCKTGIAT